MKKSITITTKPGAVVVATEPKNPTAVGESSVSIKKPALKKLTIVLPVSTHAAMKRSCQRRGVAIGSEVPQVLAAHYTGGEPVPRAPAPGEDAMAMMFAKLSGQDEEEEKTRTAFWISSALHAEIQDQAAARHCTIAEEVRKILRDQYLQPA